MLTITPNTGSQANSVVFNQPVSTHNFTASFTYTDVTGGGADGFAFMLENDPRGKTGLGGGGGSLGYSSILNSVALEGNIYSPYTVGLAMGVNGSVAGTYTPTGSVNLSSTAPVNVSLSYTDSTDTLTVQLTQGTASYQTSYANCGLQANVGPFAYLGITGATGGAAGAAEYLAISPIRAAAPCRRTRTTCRSRPAPRATIWSPTSMSPPRPQHRL